MFARLGITVTGYTEWVLRWRWAVMALTLLAAVGIASGARHLGFSTDYRVFFSKENPQLVAFEELQDVYTKDGRSLTRPASIRSRISSTATPKATTLPSRTWYATQTRSRRRIWSACAMLRSPSCC